MAKKEENVYDFLLETGKKLAEKNMGALFVIADSKKFFDTVKLTDREKNISKVVMKEIQARLQFMIDVGLDYLTLDRKSGTLSGGEAQRLRLSRELSKRSSGNTLYILDEPTTGLHFEDIRKLLDVLNRLVEKGNTVIVIEHNLDVIKTADYIIDLGPEGGNGGGEIVAKGKPEEIARITKSWTGMYLKDVLKKVLSN